MSRGWALFLLVFATCTAFLSALVGDVALTILNMGFAAYWLRELERL